MTDIEFEAIGLHDLVELEADGRHIEVGGWYHVEWTNPGWGEHILEVEILGTHKQPRTLRAPDAPPLIRRHIRAADIPAIVEAFDRAMEKLRTIGISRRILDKVFGLTETS